MRLLRNASRQASIFGSRKTISTSLIADILWSDNMMLLKFELSLYHHIGPLMTEPDNGQSVCPSVCPTQDRVSRQILDYTD